MAHPGFVAEAECSCDPALDGHRVYGELLDYLSQDRSR
jgi:hypothetical protein